MKTITAKSGRIPSLDLVRGFTSLFIPFIHSLLMFSQPETINTACMKPFVFIAEWPGAQLFLLLMGYHFVSSNTSLYKTLLRSLILLCIAYSLNFFKFQLPLFLNIMPPEWISEVISENYSPLLIGDILHTAALSLPVLFLCKHLPSSPIITIMVLVIMLTFYPQVNVQTSNNAFFKHFTECIIGQPPYSYFPLLPWISFPLTGLLAAKFIQKVGNEWLWILIPLGALIMGISKLFSPQESVIFYKPSSIQCIKHIGFVIGWVGLWHLITPLLKNTTFGNLLIFCSRNLTLSYCIQWPLICFLIPVFGFHSLSILHAFIAATFITILTFTITAFTTLNNQSK